MADNRTDDRNEQLSLLWTKHLEYDVNWKTTVALIAGLCTRLNNGQFDERDSDSARLSMPGINAGCLEKPGRRSDEARRQRRRWRWQTVDVQIERRQRVEFLQSGCCQMMANGYWRLVAGGSACCCSCHTANSTASAVKDAQLCQTNVTLGASGQQQLRRCHVNRYVDR